ncbi:D-alanyl-D-alanine carboxypeptidase family protein [Rhizobium leguminosarum]|jgi:D-alanyl-D-alanine carboxypeptidase|uniref:D-alanyl-D-alanine carboxypeptidase family protein n=1 Tax=Rhizobium leguminosarum TaxID=384 RepID=UPI002E11C50A|nr:D-alanyl-D-alanine carboxypeptidase family protein [Rhizobium leguminosarum]
MRKSFLLPIMSAIVLAAVTFHSPAQASPKILVDLDAGSVLYAQDADISWFPASVTKLMTASLAFDAMASGRAGPDFPVVMTDDAAALPPSKLGLAPGQSLRLEDALRITMTRSMNDVATAIGENLAGSKDGFVALMNAEARRLGMNGTHFVNPSGLPDPKQVSTAQDLAILASHILSTHPDKAWLFSLPQVDFAGRTYRNTNGLIGSYPGAMGMKTGYVCGSGFNLVSVAKRGDRRLLAIVLGAPNARRRERAAAALLDYGFAGARPIGRLSSDAVGPSPATDLKRFSCGRTWGGFSELLAVRRDATPKQPQADVQGESGLEAVEKPAPAVVRKIRRF